MAYRIEISFDALEHLTVLTANQRAAILDEIEVQLTQQPTVKTKNRKQLRPNLFATWELRIGNFRVFYEVLDEPEAIVYVLAVGIKRRNQLWIGNEVIKL